MVGNLQRLGMIEGAANERSRTRGTGTTPWTRSLTARTMTDGCDWLRPTPEEERRDLLSMHFSPMVYTGGSELAVHNLVGGVSRSFLLGDKPC